MPNPTVNIIGADPSSTRGYGWALDGRMVAEALRPAGFDVAFVDAHFYWGEGLVNDVRARLAREALGLRHRLRPRCDINVFVERIVPQLFPAARHQVLIPNQEWFPEKWVGHLPRFAAVACKTREGERIFSGLGGRTAFTSFTSEDRRRPGVEMRREFLMLTGKRLAIADRVIAVWARHPEWPRLTLTGKWMSEAVRAPNLRLIRDYLPGEEIVRLQNEHRFHLAVTTAEGFGHKHNEAMACGALPFAVDAPPMNELVAPERGFLVAWDRSNPKRFGTEYHFTDASLEQAIEDCLGLDESKTLAMAARARTWFESNDVFFRRGLPALLHRVLAAKP